ncbi:uncharacterized protein LOC142769119 isoform X2 [Rhipicephalus microplus]|uniref:uncharacterized protein LOC142769119 isoform X2 n=1 Tax=Rhipicephalus microplus TaxID=6941 RepID=UPI003F6A7F32
MLFALPAIRGWFMPFTRVVSRGTLPFVVAPQQSIRSSRAPIGLRHGFLRIRGRNEQLPKFMACASHQEKQKRPTDFNHTVEPQKLGITASFD